MSCLALYLPFMVSENHKRSVSQFFKEWWELLFVLSNFICLPTCKCPPQGNYLIIWSLPSILFLTDLFFLLSLMGLFLPVTVIRMTVFLKSFSAISGLLFLMEKNKKNNNNQNHTIYLPQFIFLMVFLLN